MFRLYRVTGPSMAPTLSTGDIVLLRKRRARDADIVVVNHAVFGTIIKRISPEGHLSGDGAGSTSDVDLGLYDPATLIGVAILLITPTKLRRLSGRRSGTRALDSE